MTGPVIPRPKPDEAAPVYHGYIDRVTGENITEQLGDQLDQIGLLFRNVNDTAALFRYAPGKWSVKEIVGHLSDTERIFVYRLLRISREDPTPLPGYDENAYVPAGAFDGRSLASLLEEFRSVRLATITLLEGLPEAAWTRRGQANGKSISSRAIAYILVGHVTHHLAVLQERYGIGRAMISRPTAG
jgi:hypothetical protein